MTPGEASAKGELLLIEGEPAAHVFDLADGIAFITYGWANGSGGGQPCHMIRGTFQTYDPTYWIAMDTEHGDVIVERVTNGPKPDGPRSKAREILQRSLLVEIPE